MNQILALLDRSSPAPVVAAARSLAVLLGASVAERFADDPSDALASPLAAVVIAGCGPPAVTMAASLSAPVLVVPADCEPAPRIQRILVPLDGTPPSSAASRPLIETAPQAGVEIVVVHAMDAETCPAFTDQPQHELSEWGRELLARRGPWGGGVDAVQFEHRVGPAEDVITATASDRECDAIVLSWNRSTRADRSAVVRATVDRARHPVLPLPAEAGV